MKPKSTLKETLNETLNGISISKKGFILTLDVMMAITLVLIVLFGAIAVISFQANSKISEHQLLVIGSDIVIVMDEKGYFNSLDHGDIESELSVLLPATYGMKLQINGNFTEGNGTIEVGDDILAYKDITVGEYIAVTENYDYLFINYYVWVNGDSS